MAVALALFTSVAYGVSNYVGPRLARATPLVFVLLVGQSAALVLAAALVAARGTAVPEADEIAFGLLAGVGNALALILVYRAAAIGPLSVVMPLGALGAAIPVVAGAASGESIGLVKLAGIVLALGGVMLVARRQAPSLAPPPGAREHSEEDRRRSIVLALAAAAFFGVFLAAMGPASDGGADWAVFTNRTSLVAVLFGFALHEGVLRGTPAGRLPALAVPGLLLFAGTLAYAAATNEGDLGVVSVIGSLFPVFTVALAAGLDHERLSRSQAAGAAAVLAGVVLLSAR